MDLESFVYIRATAIKGTKKKAAGVETVRHYWNAFTAAWKRKYPAISEEIKESIHEVRTQLSSYDPLRDTDSMHEVYLWSAEGGTGSS